MEEQYLAQALGDKPLSQASIEDIGATLLHVYNLVGLRGENYPQGVELDFLLSYIPSHFGRFTAKEIKLAFTMAIQGKLDLDEKDVKPYENFSPLYFSSIMRAYKFWAQQAVVHVIKDIPPALPPSQTTDEEFIQACLNTYQATGKWQSIPAMLYNTLEGSLGLDRAAKNEIVSIVTGIIGEPTKDACKQYAIKRYFDKLLNEPK